MDFDLEQMIAVGIGAYALAVLAVIARITIRELGTWRTARRTAAAGCHRCGGTGVVLVTWAPTAAGWCEQHVEDGPGEVDHELVLPIPIEERWWLAIRLAVLCALLAVAAVMVVAA